MLRGSLEENRTTASPDGPSRGASSRKENLNILTSTWGNWDSVSLYLQRCQVETPDELVQATWRHVSQSRAKIGKVIDFGAGNGRFSRYGDYDEYVGYEVDDAMFLGASLPNRARMVNQCAFSQKITDADVCIGNPPFVRNQDLPRGWRQHAAKVLRERTGVSISGLANAWQYFFFLSLISVKESGLCALIIPYEWVSRPSASAIREYIKEKSWNVSVYRLIDASFSSVLTTASITIIDKGNRDGNWTYFEETNEGTYKPLPSPSGGVDGVIPYLRRSETPEKGPRAKRGLSPGTQKALTLTEGERVRSGLSVKRDVVPCVTSLRCIPANIQNLDEFIFRMHYRTPNQKCWLIRTDTVPSPALRAYLSAVPEKLYQTSTCLERAEWWKFLMPEPPGVLIAMSFKEKFPKTVRNHIGARAVGGVYGIYNLTASQADKIMKEFGNLDLGDKIVSHSNGLRKIEIGQLNTLLLRAFDTKGGIVS